MKQKSNSLKDQKISKQKLTKLGQLSKKVRCSEKFPNTTLMCFKLRKKQKYYQDIILQLKSYQKKTIFKH